MCVESGRGREGKFRKCLRARALSTHLVRSNWWLQRLFSDSRFAISRLCVIVGKVLDPRRSVPQLLNQLVVPGLYCVVGISAMGVLSNIYPVLTICQALL